MPPQTVWADDAYQRALADRASDAQGAWLQIVHKLRGATGYRRASQAPYVRPAPAPPLSQRGLPDEPSEAARPDPLCQARSTSWSARLVPADFLYMPLALRPEQ